MNTTKQLQQIKLDQWSVLCKEQSKSGLTVKQWCDQNGCTIHTLMPESGMSAGFLL